MKRTVVYIGHWQLATFEQFGKKEKLPILQQHRKSPVLRHLKRKIKKYIYSKTAIFRGNMRLTEKLKLQQFSNYTNCFCWNKKWRDFEHPSNKLQYLNYPCSNYRCIYTSILVERPRISQHIHFQTKNCCLRCKKVSLLMYKSNITKKNC